MRYESASTETAQLAAIAKIKQLLSQMQTLSNALLEASHKGSLDELGSEYSYSVHELLCEPVEGINESIADAYDTLDNAQEQMGRDAGSLYDPQHQPEHSTHQKNPLLDVRFKPLTPQEG